MDLFGLTLGCVWIPEVFLRKETDYVQLWESVFGKFDAESVQTFVKEYKGTDEEAEDIKKLFTLYRGNSDKILRALISAETQEVPRVLAIIESLRLESQLSTCQSEESSETENQLPTSNGTHDPSEEPQVKAKTIYFTSRARNKKKSVESESLKRSIQIAYYCLSTVPEVLTNDMLFAFQEP